jgi:unsaturated chondroitin disaccharide hydrolase
MPHLMTSSSQDWISAALSLALEKVARLRDTADGFPVATEGGQWRNSAEGTWTAGFWPGSLWLAYALTDDHLFGDAARLWSTRLAPHQLNRWTHDLGMQFTPSWVTGYRLTGDRAFRHGALAAAETLVDRFNTKGQYLRAIGVPGTDGQAGYVIVDTLMNLPLLFWAGQELGEPRFGDTAMRHIRTSISLHVRADGSTTQVFNFDPDTGTPMGPGVHQGMSSDSCWSRGQAWAIAGLAECARWSGDRDVLAAATKIADWWIDHCAPTTVAPWDFSAPPDAPRDSSASAIAANGLLSLAGLTGLASYGNYAAALLETLWQECTTDDPADAGLLLHATGFLPAGRDIDVSLVYGDYFFFLGLLRLGKPLLFSNRIEIGVN